MHTLQFHCMFDTLQGRLRLLNSTVSPGHPSISLSSSAPIPRPPIVQLLTPATKKKQGSCPAFHLFFESIVPKAISHPLNSMSWSSLKKMADNANPMLQYASGSNTLPTDRPLPLLKIRYVTRNFAASAPHYRSTRHHDGIKGEREKMGKETGRGIPTESKRRKLAPEGKMNARFDRLEARGDG
ncbi:hypothetical protein VTI74DRAFT_4760 [Chaetomium olivicolor]